MGRAGLPVTTASLSVQFGEDNGDSRDEPTKDGSEELEGIGEARDAWAFTGFSLYSNHGKAFFFAGGLGLAGLDVVDSEPCADFGREPKCGKR